MFGRGVMGIIKAIAPNMVVFMVFDVIQNAFQAVSTNTTQYGPFTPMMFNFYDCVNDCLHSHLLFVILFWKLQYLKIA